MIKFSLVLRAFVQYNFIHADILFSTPLFVQRKKKMLHSNALITSSAEEKALLLKTPIQHIDIKEMASSIAFIDAMEHMALQARNLSRAAKIYAQMLEDKSCSIILCLAGSLISSGLKKVVIDLLENNMIDAIVSTGANVVDQDFFEGLGFKHYQGTPFIDDVKLAALSIDRIYDTYIDEDHLRVCDNIISQIANNLPAKVYSSREFIYQMGAYLAEQHPQSESLVLSAYRKQVPIFVPAFSDCSAGFGLILHQVQNPHEHITIDSVRDFRELTELKLAAGETGLLMVGGGVPKNFTQDIVVAAELLGHTVPLHKYAVQITVADERDGGLSGSTLKEACSWGKVSVAHEQMVFSEATLALPLLTAYAYHRGSWKNRTAKQYHKLYAAN